MDHVVIAGAGLAGHRAARALRDGGYSGRLTVVGDEAHLPYDRPPLSKQVLEGAADVSSLFFDTDGLDAEWRLGNGARALDTSAHVITTADGAELGYDRLVIATGRAARHWPGLESLQGVHVIRSIGDTAAFRAEATAPGAEVVIVGAGFVGCEAAATLRKLGVDSVTMVDIAPTPMTVLGADIGRFAANYHQRRGVRLMLGVGVERFTDDGRKVTGVQLDGGEFIPADVVLLGLGSVPNTGWLQSSGLTLDRGAVACDGWLFAEGADDVLAVGDVAAFPHPRAPGRVCIEHWTNARETAELAAANLLAAEPGDRKVFEAVPTFWSDQYDLKIKSAGFIGQADSFAVVEFDPDKPSMVVEALRDGELVGAVTVNKNRKIIEYTRALAATAAV